MGVEDDDFEAEIDRRAEHRRQLDEVRARVLSGPGKGGSYYVLEGSRTDFFLRMLDHKDVQVGASLELLLTYKGHEIKLGGTVVRKETSPRCGIVIHIASILAGDKLTYRRLVLGML